MKNIDTIKAILQFLEEELGGEFIAVEDVGGWRIMTTNFNGLHDPEYQDTFLNLRSSFPEFKLIFVFIGQKGVDSIKKGFLHGQKVKFVTCKTLTT